MTKPKALILTGYGINCEEETAFAFNKFGGESEVVHVNDLIDGHKKMDDYQILAIPGGFSYGDDTGAGKGMANRVLNNLQDQVLDFVKRDTLTIGICNGFQVLTALGLTPSLNEKYGERQAALMANTSARYICRWVRLKNTTDKCVWTKGIDTLYVPIAHGEGNFYIEDEQLKELEENNQVAFKYIKEDGSLAEGVEPFNPNGSLNDIAGICDPSGRILGMMPHPERAMFFYNRPDFANEKERMLREGQELPSENEGGLIFKNAVEYFE